MRFNWQQTASHLECCSLRLTSLASCAIWVQFTCRQQVGRELVGDQVDVDFERHTSKAASSAPAMDTRDVVCMSVYDNCKRKVR